MLGCCKTSCTRYCKEAHSEIYNALKETLGLVSAKSHDLFDKKKMAKKKFSQIRIRYKDECCKKTVCKHPTTAGEFKKANFIFMR